jgi:hypothetical protein
MIVVSIGAISDKGPDDPIPGASLESALELFVRNEPGDTQLALSMIRQLPQEVVVDQSLAILREYAALDAKSRRFVYGALTSHDRLVSIDEEALDDVIALFSEGLKDSDVRRICITGLFRVPESKRRHAADLLLANIEKQGITNTLDAEFLNSLILWGNDAKLMRPILPDIERIFHDPETDRGLRGKSAAAMLCIGPTSQTVAQFTPTDVPLLMGPIGYLGIETHGTFNTDDATREKIRQLVRGGLRHADREVRTHALEALLPAYSHDFVVEDEEGKHRANPELVQALSEFVANEPDEELRKRAQSVLDTMDQRVRKHVRRQMKQTP